MYELILRHASHLNEKIAFADADGVLSYGDLARRTALVAGNVRVERGSRVALYLSSGVPAIVATLGVSRAAAVGVPLDTRIGDDDLRFRLLDSGAGLVVTDREHLAQVRRVAGVRVAVVDDLLTPTRTPPRDDLAPDSPAWLHYTSGTSGDPKGVVSTQAAWLRPAEHAYRGLLGMSGHDHLLWPLPLFHAFGHSMCVVGVLALGASAYVMDRFTPERAAELLRRQSFTALGGVPTVFAQLLDAGVPLPARCLSAGAPLPQELRDRFRRTFDRDLHDGYGSTETSGKIAVDGVVLPGIETRFVDGEIQLRLPGADEWHAPGTSAGRRTAAWW